MRNADKDKRQQRGVSGWKPVRTFDGFVPCTPCRALASNNARRAIVECRAGNARRLPLIQFCNRSWNSRCCALRITYEGSVITEDNAETRSQKRPERDPTPNRPETGRTGDREKEVGKDQRNQPDEGDRQVRAKTLLNPSDAFVASLIRVQ
jgi:hypothetical protein